MALKNRIFISFADEHKILKDILVGQARTEESPFEFVDMSVEQPWDLLVREPFDSSWKTNCRARIKDSDGMLIIVTWKTMKDEGQRWEMRCAKEENIPCHGIWGIGMHGYSDEKPAALPSQFDGIQIVDWTWENIRNWLDTL